MTNGWESYFQVLADVCVTSFAVLFVVIQLKLNADEWMIRPAKRAAAVSDMTELLVPLLAALLILIPSGPWRWAFGVTGSVGMAVCLWYWLIYFSELRRHPRPEPPVGGKKREVKRTVRRSGPEPDDFDSGQARLNLLSFAIYGCFVVAASTGNQTLYGVSAVLCAWLVFSGTTEGWWLVTEHSSRDSRERPGSLTDAVERIGTLVGRRTQASSGRASASTGR